ncbi:MAG: hypothetical protein WAK48_15575 [Candidatus Acidiferrum sp.]
MRTVFSSADGLDIQCLTTSGNLLCELIRFGAQVTGSNQVVERAPARLILRISENLREFRIHTNDHVLQIHQRDRFRNRFKKLLEVSSLLRQLAFNHLVLRQITIDGISRDLPPGHGNWNGQQ